MQQDEEEDVDEAEVVLREAVARAMLNMSMYSPVDAHLVPQSPADQPVGVGAGGVGLMGPPATPASVSGVIMSEPSTFLLLSERGSMQLQAGFAMSPSTPFSLPATPDMATSWWF
eukprot:2470403-Rhodomonas_salina.1